MRENKLLEVFNSGEPTIGTRIHSPWPNVTEMLGHVATVGYVEYVAEYSEVSIPVFKAIATVAELMGLGSMIKLDRPGEELWGPRAFSEGFGGAMLVDVYSAEELEQRIQAMLPDTPRLDGKRGMRYTRDVYPYPGTPDDVRSMEHIVFAAMIEKVEAVTDGELEKILQVEWLKMIQWGPGDFTVSAGKPGQGESAEFKEIEERVIQTALEHDVRPRVEIDRAQDAEPYLEMGVRDFSLGTDMTILREYWTNDGAALQTMLSRAQVEQPS